MLCKFKFTMHVHGLSSFSSDTEEHNCIIEDEQKAVVTYNYAIKATDKFVFDTNCCVVLKYITKLLCRG